MTTIKNIFVSVVVAAIVSLGVSFIVAPKQTTQVVGAVSGNVQSVTWTFLNGISLDGLTSHIESSGTIPAGANQGFWTNKTGRTVYVDYADLAFQGVASSSVRVSVATSTTSSIANNFAAPFGSLIDNQLLATSTPLAAAIINSDIGAGTNGKGTIVVLPGVSVVFFFRQDDIRACNGATCETATSTNRGFSTVQWFMQGHFRP